jgi:hypothetical protein
MAAKQHLDGAYISLSYCQWSAPLVFNIQRIGCGVHPFRKQESHNSTDSEVSLDPPAPFSCRLLLQTTVLLAPS